MKCAGCQKMHHGIANLMPWRVSSVIRGMKSYDMLCPDCTTERNEAESKYKKASHGD